MSGVSTRYCAWVSVRRLVWVGFIDTTVIDDRLVATLVGLFGLLNIAAALLRVCPFYNLAGINTNNQDD